MIGVFSRSRNLIYFRTISSLKKSSIVRKLRLKPLQIQTNTNQLRTKLSLENQDIVQKQQFQQVLNQTNARKLLYCQEIVIKITSEQN